MKPKKYQIWGRGVAQEKAGITQENTGALTEEKSMLLGTSTY